MNMTRSRQSTIGQKNASVLRPIGAMVIAFALTAPLIIISASGCGGPPIDSRDYEDPERPLASIFVRDPDLAKALGFRVPNVIRDEDGFITRVEIVTFAESVNTLKIDYRPAFIDREGASLEPGVSWQTRFIEPNVPERIVLTPNSPHAVDYELSIRWSR